MLKKRPLKVEIKKKQQQERHLLGIFCTFMSTLKQQQRDIETSFTILTYVLKKAYKEINLRFLYVAYYK